MKAVDFVKRMSADLSDFTLVKSEVNPFGWDYSDSGLMKGIKGRKKVRQDTSQAYSITNDFRLKSGIKDAKDPDARRTASRYFSLAITKSFFPYAFRKPDKEELTKLLEIAELPPENMLSVVEWFKEENQPELLLFQDPNVNDIAILFYVLLWSLTDAEFGSTIQFLGEDYKQNKKGFKTEDYKRRFLQFVEYITEQGLFVLDDKLTEIPEESSAAFDTYVYQEMKYYYKFFITQGEMEKEHQRVLSENKKLKEMISKRKAVTAYRFQQTSIKAATGKFDSKAVFNTATPPDLKDRIISTFPEVERRFYKQYNDNLKALDQYQKDLWTEGFLVRNSALLEKNEYDNSLSQTDIVSITKGALSAILKHDEILYNSPLIRWAVGLELGSLLGFPVTIEEDKEFDGIYVDCPDKEKEEILPIRAITYENKERMNAGPMTGETPFLEQEYIGRLLSTRARHCINRSPELNLEIVKKLEEIGIDTSKARELASYAEGMREIVKSNNGIYNRYLSLALSMEMDKQEESNHQDKSSQTELIAVKKRLKQSEDEKQTLRHEISAIEKERDEYKKEIEELKKQLLDQKNKKQDSSSAEISKKPNSYPFYTEKNVVLAGGRNEFYDKLKAYIPNIRHVPLAIHYDENVFKNADIVFMKIDYMDHSSYYKIIDAAKRGGTKIHHLNWVSAERCAEEIVSVLKN